jgi:two-component system, cell cycle response regulator
MEPVTDTWRTAPRRPISATHPQACLVHIYPTGANMGQRHPLGEQVVVLGRGEDCQIQISDHSVSRRHARIEKNGDSFFAIDLQSTNGTFVNNMGCVQTRLKDGDYLQIGNCIFRFLAGGNVEAEYHEEIYRLTIIDALTGAHNKRFFEEFLDREMARSTRHHRPLAIVMFDIDHFKAVNDELGHLAGDYTLRELAQMVRPKIRREDLFARYGGEEFVLILVESTYQGAMDLAQRIRAMVEKRNFECDGRPFQVTVSLGVAATNGADGMTTHELIRRADERLLEAKRAGRNRVCG